MITRAPLRCVGRRVLKVRLNSHHHLNNSPNATPTTATHRTIARRRQLGSGRPSSDMRSA